MSALSSLLVRDRVVNVRTIEDALQRQVISGGDLETALLEMSAIPEDTLAAYRAALVGGLAATRAELTRADPAAVALLPSEVALRHRLVPLRKEGARVVVAASEQPPADALGELSFLLGAQLDVRITTPFRLQWALAQRYGAELSARYRRLSDKLEQRDPGAVPRVAPLVGARRPSLRPGAEATTPVARPSSTSLPSHRASAPTPNERPSQDRLDRVSLERVSASEVTGPLSDPGDPSPAESTGAAETNATTETSAPVHAAAPAELTASSARTDSSATIETRATTETSAETETNATTESSAPAETARESVIRTTIDVRVVGSTEAPTAPSAPGPHESDAVTGETVAGMPVPMSDPRSQAPSPVGPRPASEPAPASDDPASVAMSRTVQVRRAGEGVVQVPPTREEITAAFAATTDRNGVLATAFAMARRLVDYCALFVVQDDVAEGRDAAGPGADRDAVSNIAVPLDAPGTLADVRASATIYIGPPHDDATDEIVQKQLGRVGVSPIVMLPVHIRGRMVLAIYGDCSGRSIPLDANDSAEQIAHEAADALTRIILMKKRESSRAPAMTPVLELLRDSHPDAALLAAVLPGAYAGDDHDTERPPPSHEESPRSVFMDEHTEPSMAAPLLPRGLHPDLHDTDTDIEVVTLSSAAAAALEAEETNAASDASGAYRLTSGATEEVVYTPKPRTPVPMRGGDTPPRRRTNTPVGGYSMGSRRDKPFAVDRVELHEATAQDSTPRPSMPRVPRDEPSVIVDMGGNVAELVAALERDDTDRDSAIASLVKLGEAALPELVQRFPGTVHMPDRRSGLPRPEDIGPIPVAIVAFRDRAVSYVASLLGHSDPIHRFCAVVTAAEVLHPSLVIPLSERLLDLDDRVREAAIEVLRFASRHPEYERALAYVRAVGGDDIGDPLRRKHALQALGQLRDGGALDVLVRLVGSNDVSTAQAARGALVLLTRQDFGTQRRKWIAWADKHRNEHRVEWLIEALLHEVPEIRREASEELKRLTQEYFGYHYNQPSKERERAHRRYVLWWQDDGRRRFQPAR